MNKRNKLFRTTLQLLILMFVAGYFSINAAEFTFASNVDSSPNVIVNINGDGSMSQKGNLFDGSLFPSSKSDAENGIGSINGVIRLVSEYKKIDIENISIGLDSSEMEIRNDYPKDVVYNSFLDNIRLKIEKGRVLYFDDILVNYTSLRDLLYDANHGEYVGYNLVDENKFSLNKGDTIDLKYTLQMVEEAGNELQSVTAYMPIYINLQGHKVIDDGSGGNGSGGSDDGEHGVITPPIDIPEIDYEEIDEGEVVIEVPIPVGPPHIEDEEIVIEELEIDVEIPSGPPVSELPKTGATNPLISVGLGTILLGLGLFLRKKNS